MPDAPALELLEIYKRFGSATAVAGVSLRVRQRSVHAILGENGAGKSTLMRIAFGLIPADSGTIAIAGTRRRINSAATAIEAGIGMVHQHFTNVPAMTVAENVALGGHGRFTIEAANQRVEKTGRESGLVLDPSARAADLPVGAQQRLEIVKALARNARLLLLDEPTAVLAPAEADDLLRWLRRFADDGNSVVLVTHKLREALSIADDITVLRRGRVVLQTTADAATSDTLAAALLGDNPSGAIRGQTNIRSGRIVAAAREIEIVNERGRVALRDASFEIGAGEIVGVAAIEGAGQRELLRALAGRADVRKGELRLPQLIGFVPEDRQHDSLILPFSLSDNVALRDSGARQGRLDIRDIHQRTAAVIKEFDVRGGEPETPARALSGGNQQKLVFGRELGGSPELIVVENPTRGLDIRASRAVLERLKGAAEADAAVVMYSSDLDEVLGMATRILVVRDGLVRECARDREQVGRAMLGLS